MEKESKTLDSKVFFEIQRPDLRIEDYRKWMDAELLPKWLVEKEGNPQYQHTTTGKWNEEGGIYGNFGDDYIAHCKFYKFDETSHFSSFEEKRSILIRDHYSPEDAEKVKFISDRFEKFLQEESVQYTRQNFYRS